MHKHTTLPFGVVAIIGGRYRDKVGYYDDNDGDKLMVYLGTPLLSEVAFVSRTEARSATAEEDRAWRAQHPGLEEYEAASKNLRDQRR